MSEQVAAAVSFEGTTTMFHYSNPHDHIQSYHLRGEFYELRQLLSHRDVIPMGSTVLDIGANVGNHTMFYAKHTWAKTIYPFEPNVVARKLLQATIVGNSGFRSHISTEYAHMAVGSSSCSMHVGESHANNLGGTALAAGGADGGQTVDCVRLDDLNFAGSISFLKIDVEGMELAVLDGARNHIERHRPTIAIEISSRHEADFWRWVNDNRYVVVRAFFEYLHFKNYVIAPTC